MGISVCPGSRLILPITIHINQINLPVLALVDSGEKQNLISSDLVMQLQIPIKTLTQTLSVGALTGQTLTTISQQKQKSHFLISGNHQEG